MSADPKPIRVLFVEDHQLLADALAAMLSREPDMQVVGIAGTVADAKIMAREQLDVVLMDYRLPDGTGRRSDARHQGPLAGRARRDGDRPDRR